MKFYNVIIVFSCFVKVAAATHVQCGSNSWQYHPIPFTIADHSQAYELQLITIKCHDVRTGEVEMVYSSQPVQRISQHNYDKAQQRYRLLGGQMGLQGDIIYESFYQPVVVHKQQSSQEIQLRIKVCLSRDAAPTLSSTFINARQLLGITDNNLIIFQLQNLNSLHTAVKR